jgi:hypothetical protein
MAIITLNNNSLSSVTSLPAAIPTGKILQVIQTHVNTTSSQSLVSKTVTNITGLNASITPSSTSSKIRITCRWNGEINFQNNEPMLFGINRDSTPIGNQTSIGNRVGALQQLAQGYWGIDSTSTMDSAMWQYIDSPSSTSSITYYGTYMYSSGGSTYTLFNQRTSNDNNDENHERATSTIILEEIAG